MSRPDQSITFLRDFGFSVFRFPRASTQPLELMHREGKDLTRLGVVLDLMIAGEAPLPDVRRDTSPGIDIEGKETSKVNVAIGLSILGSFIGALGGSKLGLDAAFNRARTVTFQYTGVMEDAVDVLALEKFIKTGRVSPQIPSGTLEKLLDDEVYVVTSVLKTRKVVVAAQGETGATVKVDVPVAFAFQAVQLVFDDSGEFLTTQQFPAGDAVARALPVSPRAAGRSTPGPVFLETRGAFVRVSQ